MTKWSRVKSIIGEYDHPKSMFLSVIDQDGKISSANSTMLKTLHLEHPSKISMNFYDLLHPVHQNEFRSALNRADDGKPSVMEVYVKNGNYHAMKWQINSLGTDDGNKTYLCVGHKIIDDKRPHKFIQLGEKNYQLIVEGLNAGIFFQDINGELIAANSKAAEIFNTSLENLYKLSDIGKLWDKLWNITNISGDKVLFEGTPFMRALHTGKSYIEELKIQLRNGDYRWLHFSSQPLFEGDSKIPFAVVSNIVDVTLERSLSSKLEESEAMLRVFMKQNPNLSWVVDEDANLLFASDSFFQYFHLDPSLALNNKITELVPGTVAETMYEKHMQVLESGDITNFVEKGQWANGSNFVFHISIFPIEGVPGKKLLGGHAFNVVEKYESERKLRETNNRLLLLTRATSDAIWEWDMQSGTIFRNDSLMDMLGYQADAPKGLSWWLRRIHPDDRNRVSNKVKESTELNKQSWQEEYMFKCADGTYKSVRDKGYIVYENGLPVKMIGSLQDISSLRELESQLTSEKLSRQAELSETILRTQEKERTRIGHELHDNVNQILSTTKLFLDMLTPNDKQGKHLKKKSTDYILLAIEEIRKLSKELVVPQLSGNGLVESIQQLIDDVHMTTKIRVKFVHDFENDLLSSGKQVTILRIIQEQFKNIIKHSHATQVDILLQTKKEMTQLSVRDNGIGFAPEQTHRGIGLSNIFERSNFYNGVVNIETSEGKGCLISVAFPSTG